MKGIFQAYSLVGTFVESSHQDMSYILREQKLEKVCPG